MSKLAKHRSLHLYLICDSQCVQNHSSEALQIPTELKYLSHTHTYRHAHCVFPYTYVGPNKHFSQNYVNKKQ